MTEKTTSQSLIADIGGTNARFALCQPDGSVHDEVRFKCKDFAGPAEAANAYLEQTRPTSPPQHGAFAVASPVLGDEINMTNHPWTFSIEAVRTSLKFETLQVINDFTAIALAVPRLIDQDLQKIGAGNAASGHPIVVLGPGTGLGVSGLIPKDDTWIPLATEGGHVTMAPFSDRESAILNVLRAEGHVSAEDVISGPGLINTYRALCELEGQTPDPEITPARLTEQAYHSPNSVFGETLDTFCAFLGTIAANLCLSFGALGGVYIAGGIVPKLGQTFAESPFRTRFETKGRFSDYLRAVPTYVIQHPHPAFVGLSSLKQSVNR